MNPKNITDMTTGSPVKHILKFAFPLLIGNLFQQLYNLVDSIIVGKFVGDDAFAAVGACGSMNFMFFSLCSGLATGIGIIVSQYFGAKNDDKVRTTIANAAYVLGSAAIFVTILGLILSPLLLRLLGTPEELLGDSTIYIRTTISGMIAIAMYNGVASILRALGDSRTPLYFLIISSIVNVILDLVFVLWFGMGIFGVAFATILAQAVSAITSFIYAYKKIPYFRFKREQLKPDKSIILKSFRLGLPVAFQYSMIAISSMALQGVVNSFGKTVMSAFNISVRIEQIIQQPYSSLSVALTNYTGQNMGAGNLERVKIGFRRGVMMAAVFSLVMLPIIYLFGSSIAGMFVEDPAIIEMGAGALRITSVCYFGLGMIYIPRAVLNGAGDTAFSMINGVTEVICRILYSQVLMRIPVFGYWCVWITTGATWCTTCIICLIRYFKGKWKHKSIVTADAN